MTRTHCIDRIPGATILAAALLATGGLAHAAAPSSWTTDEVLGLRSSTTISLPLLAEPGERIVAPIVLDGVPGLLHLEPHAVRDAQYEVLVQGDDGALVPVDPAPASTYRGTIVGVPGAVVAGGLTDEGLVAAIYLPDGSRRWLEPLAARLPFAGGDAYVLYGDEDVINGGGTCAADGAHVDPADPEAEGDGGASAGTNLYVAQLACDADYEYYLDWGGVANVQNRINAVINAVNVQYERDVDISHAITTIIVRTAEPDPYSSTDALTLLNQFRNHWQSSQGGIVRDMAQLFTGKEINSSTIGIAWLSAVCTSYGYSVVQSDFNGNFSCATDLSAHELGHNWGADHCSCTSYTMNPYITCANQFSPSQSIPEIVNFRNSRTCLDVEGGGGGGGGNDPVDMTIQGLAVTTGTLVSGGAVQLADSDDAYAVIASTTSGSNRLTSSTITLGGGSGAATLDLAVECGASTNGVKVKILARRVSDGRWVRIGNGTVGTSDVIFSGTGISAATYVDAGGSVQLRVESSKKNASYQFRLDHVEVIANP